MGKLGEHSMDTVYLGHLGRLCFIVYVLPEDVIYLVNILYIYCVGKKNLYMYFTVYHGRSNTTPFVFGTCDTITYTWTEYRISLCYMA